MQRIISRSEKNKNILQKKFGNECKSGFSSRIRPVEIERTGSEVKLEFSDLKKPPAKMHSLSLEFCPAFVRFRPTVRREVLGREKRRLSLSFFFFFLLPTHVSAFYLATCICALSAIVGARLMLTSR